MENNTQTNYFVRITITAVCAVIYMMLYYGLLCAPTPQPPGYWSQFSTHKVAALHPTLPPPKHRFFNIHHEKHTQSFDIALKQQINRYVANKQTLIHTLEKARPYLAYLSSRLKAAHLPYELALLPFIESGYDPFAYSHAGATGIWQIMPHTASSLGVPINAHYDGRRDLMMSTQAALDYLHHLHQHFRDWPKAIAAYNAGKTIIQRITARPSHHTHSLHWLSHAPRETKTYVIKLLALIYILDHAQAYGITLPVVPASPPFVPLLVSRTIDLRDIAQKHHLPFKLVRTLNAGFKKSVTVPANTMRLLLPIH